MEDKVGSPERPLSDLGLITYQSYWKDTLLRFLTNYNEKNVSIKSISEDTAITPNDIVTTFQVVHYPTLYICRWSFCLKQFSIQFKFSDHFHFSDSGNVEILERSSFSPTTSGSHRRVSWKAEKETQKFPIDRSCFSQVDPLFEQIVKLKSTFCMRALGFCQRAHFLSKSALDYDTWKTFLFLIFNNCQWYR